MRQYKYQINGKKYEVSVETPAADGTIAVTVNGETYSSSILKSEESEVAQLCPTLCNPMDSSLHQAPPSMGFSRQEYWSGFPFPSPG